MIRAMSGFVLAGAIALSGCAGDNYGYGYRQAPASHAGTYDRDYRHGNGYHGDHGYGVRHANPFNGDGGSNLDPWLSDTREGQKFVTDHYDVGYDGQRRDADADEANVFFRRWADTDRDYRLTDAEIRTALVHVAHNYRYRR